MSDIAKEFSSRSECGLLALPEELLLKILAHLRLPALVSVRLVCRLLGKLPLSLITTLNTIPRRYLPAEDIVAEQLRAFPSLTMLRYRGDPRNCAALLSIPSCICILRELDLQIEAAAESIEVVCDFCTKLKCATAVTSLTWEHRMRGNPWSRCDTLFPLALANSPQLVCLDARWITDVPDASLGNILQLTALQKLRLDSRVWEQLLPHLASFPCLKDIGSVPFEERDAVERVAALTALTRLGAEAYGPFASSPALSRLSGLQVLSLYCYPSHGETSIVPLTRNLTQLTALVLHGYFLELTRLSRLVDPLRCLESLHVDAMSCPIRVLLGAPLHRLRHFSITLRDRAPSGYPALCSALAGLERLSVTSSDSAAKKLAPHLSQLTRLTALRIAAEDPSRTLLAPQPADARVPASFLTRLTTLVDLRLFHVLSANNAHSDIPCLARLTRLQWLAVESVWDTSSRLRKSSHPSKSMPVEDVPGKHVLIYSRDLRPLGALRMLERWELRDAWHWGGGNPEVVNAVVGKLCGICIYSTWHHVLERRHWSGSSFSWVVPDS